MENGQGQKSPQHCNAKGGIYGPNEGTKDSRNVSETSKETFHDLLNQGKFRDEKKVIFEAVTQHGPITSRQLAKVTGRERSSICRSLYDLLGEMSPQIKEAFIEKCPITQRRVKWYTSIGWINPAM
jgi:hypothetical protein